MVTPEARTTLLPVPTFLSRKNWLPGRVDQFARTGTGQSTATLPLPLAAVVPS
jgi:hypothetical protein